MKRHYGLTGNPLIHSFSEQYFNEKFLKEGITGASYRLFPLTDISQIRQLAVEQQLSGFNITIPYKTAILPLLDELSEDARAIGAVNTVKCSIHQTGLHLKGYNTDAPAFRQTLETLNLPEQTKVLILGNGGVSKAVQYVIRQLGWTYQLVSRTAGPGKIRYQDVSISLMNDHLLIINTTPLGMFPDLNTAAPIPYEGFSTRHIAYDLIYNPEKTKFLLLAETHGARILNGLEMLHRQAELAWKIWQEE